MSCGSCTGRGGTSGNSVLLSLADGRRAAAYRESEGYRRIPQERGGGGRPEHAERQKKTVIIQ